MDVLLVIIQNSARLADDQKKKGEHSRYQCISCFQQKSNKKKPVFFPCF